MSYVIHAQYGSYCSACQSPLSMEEADFECCDACGGEGIGNDEDLDIISRPRGALHDTAHDLERARP
ncbi:hypothetical protein JF546_09710 [Nitratireductor aquimarinus]|uniref:hypothetical protein n=1 Tax=Nitratireductor aquimarinus TaxID=889300 RepID=UPI001A8DD776|nr:hypothetical protein [Nitratireductor aquimarinus]MBN8243285.1 hypothetical protein [Nitratireductor aquimarinus]MBY6131186.1 hypothetical protein [Nitratireductor aquimarinus]MCA1302058.1 hypothetical protein [Nitratireductor aquimarinus]